MSLGLNSSDFTIRTKNICNPSSSTSSTPKTNIGFAIDFEFTQFFNYLFLNVLLIIDIIKDLSNLNVDII